VSSGAHNRPPLGDFTAFLKSLIQALRVTQEQPEKFDRFAQAVLTNPTDADKAALQARVSDQLNWLEQYGTQHAYASIRLWPRTRCTGQLSISVDFAAAGLGSMGRIGQ
jgi:hypothetical protein